MVNEQIITIFTNLILSIAKYHSKNRVNEYPNLKKNKHQV